MNVFIQWAVHSELFHFALYILFSALVGGMPAPTVSSGVGYVWAFRSLNILASNIKRAGSTAVENSPNFLAAAQKAQDQGQLPPKP